MNTKVTKACNIEIKYLDKNRKVYKSFLKKWNGRVKSDLEAQYDENGDVLKDFAQNSEVFQKYIENEVNNIVADNPPFEEDTIIEVSVSNSNLNKTFYLR